MHERLPAHSVLFPHQLFHELLLKYESRFVQSVMHSLPSFTLFYRCRQNSKILLFFKPRT